MSSSALGRQMLSKRHLERFLCARRADVDRVSFKTTLVVLWNCARKMALALEIFICLGIQHNAGSSSCGRA